MRQIFPRVVCGHHLSRGGLSRASGGGRGSAPLLPRLAADLGHLITPTAPRFAGLWPGTESAPHSARPPAGDHATRSLCGHVSRFLMMSLQIYIQRAHTYPIGSVPMETPTDTSYFAPPCSLGEVGAAGFTGPFSGDVTCRSFRPAVRRLPVNQRVPLGGGVSKNTFRRTRVRRGDKGREARAADVGASCVRVAGWHRLWTRTAAGDGGLSAGTGSAGTV